MFNPVIWCPEHRFSPALLDVVVHACLSDGPVIPYCLILINSLSEESEGRWTLTACLPPCDPSAHVPAVARACGDGTPRWERGRAAWKSICKLNDGGSGQTGAGGAAAGEERVRKGNDRSEGGGEEGSVHVHLTNIGQKLIVDLSTFLAVTIQRIS